MAAVDRLTRAGTIAAGDTVVAVMTATGLKDSGAGGDDVAAPTVAPDLEAVRVALHDRYGFDG